MTQVQKSSVLAPYEYGRGDNMNDKAEIMIFLMEQFLNKCCSELDEQQIKRITAKNDEDIRNGGIK